ncbi:MAG: hypothetical protein QME40_03860 [bacterium]|nr:hypothetical protein [bacterium]
MRTLTVVFIILVLFGTLFQPGCAKKKEVAPPAEEEEVTTPEEEEEVTPLEEEKEETPSEEEGAPLEEEGGEE